MDNTSFLNISLQKLLTTIEAEEYKGYDPYDILNSRFPFSVFGRWIPIIATSLHKKNPFNLRPLLGIKKEYNPKGMGLLLWAYSLLYHMNPHQTTRKKMDWIFHWLRENYTKGFSGFCWGYNFDWAGRHMFLPSHSPSIVVSGLVSKGLLAFYRATGRKEAVSMIEGTADFILEDLDRTEDETGVCFSYSTRTRDCIYNASLMGAELLASLYSINKTESFKDLALKAAEFVVKRQHSDGHWNYGVDPHTQKESEHIDFHQGFVLESLKNIVDFCRIDRQSIKEAIKKGARFYQKQQFFPDGRSLGCWPREWPINIHSQAQGIITFINLAQTHSEYLDFAKTIADWTIKNMQDRTGYFYYRKYRHFTNKISYMRWNNAWMLVALILLKRHFAWRNNLRPCSGGAP